MNSHRNMGSMIIIFVQCILTILFITGEAYSQPADCAGEMIHYWKMDDSGSPYDDYYGTSNTACTNCPAAVTGIIDGSQEFDGIDDAVDVTDDNTFDWASTDSFSIELWIKTDSSNTCDGSQVFAGRDDSTSTSLQWWVGCKTGTKTAAFHLRDTSGTDIAVFGSTVLPDGAWHHIAAVRDADTDEIRIYVDGVLEGSESAAYSAGFDSLSAELNIGYLHVVVPEFHFAGTVDEVALYSRAFSADEISRHYYDGKVGLGLGYCGCNTNVAIMPLGDSITEGDPGTVGYRRQLYLSLGNDGYTVDFVGSQKTGGSSFDEDHEGHGGFEASDVEINVYNWLMSNPAKVVLLHIGTNELDSVTPAEFTANVEDILDEIDRYEADENMRITVVLARIIDTQSGHANVPLFNDSVEAMAEARIDNGDEIIIVDQEHALTYPDDMDSELHPNTSGYNKMADVWLAALRNFLPVCPAPVAIYSEPVIEAGTGIEYTYNVNATSGHTVDYSIITAPSGMTINENNGLIEWIPGAVGTSSDVSVYALNTTGDDTQDFTITVVEYPSDMIHYWKLDESFGNEFHDFYGGNHARCNNCPSAITGIVATGIGNGGTSSGYGAQDFNGSDDTVDVSDDNTFDWTSTDGFSIELWIKTDSSNTCAGSQVFVGRDDRASSSLHWWVGCKSSTTLPFFDLRDTSGTEATVTGTTVLADGAWHHIAAVRDAGTNEIRLYVDGVLEGTGSVTYSAGFDSLTADLNIGYLHTDVPEFHFDGTVDEVALYSRALSSDEISLHHSNGLNSIGNVVSTKDINLTDSIDPTDDLEMNFGSIDETLSSAAETVTISNVGNTDILVSDVQLTGSNPGEFSLDLNGGSNPCTSTAFNISSGGNCTVTVTFSPTTTGSMSANLEITSDDPDENTVIIALSGTGTLLVVNDPPSAAQLVYPSNNQTGLGTTVNFSWNESTDPDGDAVTYTLTVCKDTNFTTGCKTNENIAFLVSKGIYYAGTGSGLFVFGIAFAGIVVGRRKMPLFLAAVIISATLIVACGGGGGGGGGGGNPAPSGDITSTVSGLSAGTTYYWKVQTNDGNGHTVDSETRTFTTN